MPNSNITNSNPLDTVPRNVSWYRRLFASLSLYPLPLPRVLRPGDLCLSPRHVRQRERDEVAVKALQKQIAQAVQTQDRATIGKLLKETYALLYGPNLLPQDRQDFLQVFGCTGWTDEILSTLLELGQDRGFVEMGAGNGQWARVLTDRYHASLADEDELATKLFDFVLAYDSMTELPLNPNIYHKKTQPYKDHFFSHVQPLASDHDLERVLQQWSTRGRVLLLVYPPPGDMAYRAVRSYAETSNSNDTLVYVGEGRGGANANEAFFDYLKGAASSNNRHHDNEEEPPWILVQTLPVRIFGTKGYEQLYILKRQPQQQRPPSTSKESAS